MLAASIPRYKNNVEVILINIFKCFIYSSVLISVFSSFSSNTLLPFPIVSCCAMLSEVCSKLLYSCFTFWLDSRLRLLLFWCFRSLLFAKPSPSLQSDSASDCFYFFSPVLSKLPFLGASHFSILVRSTPSSCLTRTREPWLLLSGGLMGVSISTSSTFTCTAKTAQKKIRLAKLTSNCEQNVLTNSPSCSSGSAFGSMRGTFGGGLRESGPLLSVALCSLSAWLLPLLFLVW